MKMIRRILNQIKKHSNLIKIIVLLSIMVLTILSINRCSYHKNNFDRLKINAEDLEQENKYLNDIIKNQEKEIEEYKKEVEDLNTEVAKQKQNNVNTENMQSTYVWEYLTSNMGLNNYVAAGIMGNIMAEVGGNTLDISRYSCVESGPYFGMCQWAGGRKNRLLNDFGTSIADQCRFLEVELYEVIPRDNDFYDMQDEKEAALYFAKHYERCNSKYYYIRQVNATNALKHFTK